MPSSRCGLQRRGWPPRAQGAVIQPGTVVSNRLTPAGVKIGDDVRLTNVLGESGWG